jgi:urease accessory protein
MNGALRVRVDERRGETRVIDSYANAPFHYLPLARRGEGLPVLTLVNSSGGVLGGDRLDLEIDVGERACLAVRSQSATKLHRSNRGTACARSRFRLAEGALLDYFPEETIPFADSDFEQVTEVTLAPGAVLVFVEIVAAGRLERGERFAFRRLVVDFRCRASGRGGEVQGLRDRYDLQPSLQRLSASSILGDATIWGTFYLLTSSPLEDPLVEALDESLRSSPDCSGGATRSPFGASGRVVGCSLEALRTVLQRTRDLALRHGQRLRGQA